MTQQEALNRAYRQLPDPKTYADDWCTIRFNTDKVQTGKSDGYLMVDQNYIKHFDSSLPFEVTFTKFDNNGILEWKLLNNDFSGLDKI
jgi:hypothetical protein